MKPFRNAVLITLVLLGVLLFCWLLYAAETNRIAARQAERETVRVSLLSKLLLSELRPVADDLRLLSHGDSLHRYLDTGDAAALQLAIRRAGFISERKPAYDQLRFIDTSGQEIMRVNSGGQVVAAPQLQNRADLRFFILPNALAPESLYISTIDLTVDYGKVTMPPRPVLRMAMPVFDASGRRRGIYIVNFLATSMIERLQKADSEFSQRLRLLNHDGYWLKAADPAQEWGFELAERAAFTLARSDPALWQAIRTQPAGQQRDGSSLFTWQHLLTADFAGPVSGQLLVDDDYLVVGSQVSKAEWQAMFTGLRQTMLPVAGGLVLFTLASFWLFLGRRRAVLALRSMNQQLEQRVHERTQELAQSFEQLQYREQLLEETGHLAKVGGWDFDPETGAGRWTAEVARIHGLDVARQPSKELGLQFYPGESRQRLEAALQKALADGTPYDLELEFITAQGEQKWVRTISRPVLENGKVTHMRGALQDVTERKLAEIRLNAQLQRMHLLERTTRAISERQDLPSILQVVIRTLEEQMPLDFGCICLYDPVERMLTVAAVGIASTAVAGQMSMSERSRIPIDANGLSRCVQGQVVYEEDIWKLDFPFPQRLAGGGLRAMVAAPLQVESKVFGVLIAARREPLSFSSSDCEFLRQVSEHLALAAHQAQLHDALQLAYEDLRNTQQAVMQQERLRVLGQMASGIAHDINNAISPITLYADSLLETEVLSERARANLRTIQQAAGDVAETVARLREFYRQRDRHGEHGSIDLNKLMLQVRDLTRARWESIPQQHGIVIDLQMQLAAALPPVHGVESEIREALINLVFNAVDAMPTGGKLALRTSASTDGHVHAEVIDTGAGMDEETSRRCLEPFFTTKGERGTGLGLAMAYGVMERHGGEIRIQSARGEGTTVKLTFVAAGASPTPATEVQFEVPRGLSILLVDDDPILLNSLRETLELDGHSIVVAHGGQLGIDAFRSSLQPGGTAISIVITDLGMPHVDGRSVAAAVKRASPDTPVVLLTGWGERLLAEGQTPPHVDRVLGKPPRLRDLRRVLAELAGAARRTRPAV